MNPKLDAEIALQRDELNRVNKEIHYKFNKGEITARQMQAQSLQVIQEFNKAVHEIMNRSITSK